MLRVIMKSMLLVTSVLSFISHSQVKETRKKIAVIDSGISDNPSLLKYLCRGGHVDYTRTSLKDMNGHGTNVAGLIAAKMNPKTHCLLILKFYHTYEKPFGNNYEYSIIAAAMEYLNTVAKPSFINMSLSGPSFSSLEYAAMSSLLEKGVKIIVAAGNNSLDLSISCTQFPACYFFNQANFFVVGNRGSEFSNKKGPVNVIREGNDQCALGICRNGTSQAAANFTAELVSKDK